MEPFLNLREKLLSVPGARDRMRNRNLLILAVCLPAVLWPVMGSSQTQTVEVFVQGGIARAASDESSLGTGPSGGGAIVLPIGSDRFAIDVDVQVTDTTRSFTSGVEFGARQILLNPAVVHRWSAGGGYIFAGGGIGMETARHESNLVPRNTPYETDLTLLGKSGYTFPISERLLVRLDVLAGFRYVLPNLGLRVGLGYRF